MEKTGEKLRTKKIWDIEMWGTDAIYKMVMLLPSWKMRSNVIKAAQSRLKSQREWEKHTNGISI